MTLWVFIALLSLGMSPLALNLGEIARPTRRTRS